MKKLLQGIAAFRKSLTEEKRRLFASLALGQKPDALLIACSDSRVVPNLFASTNPGDLFVLRNIGNLIPPCNDAFDNSVSAALEFATFSLNVQDIIICGHSECGAMQAIADIAAQPDTPKPDHLRAWLRHGQGACHIPPPNSHLSKVNQLSQTNTLLQLQHLMSYPFIQEKVEQGRLHLHGWWFDIAQAGVYSYDPQRKKFILIE